MDRSQTCGRPNRVKFSMSSLNLRKNRQEKTIIMRMRVGMMSLTVTTKTLSIECFKSKHKDLVLTRNLKKKSTREQQLEQSTMAAIKIPDPTTATTMKEVKVKLKP